MAKAKAKPKPGKSKAPEPYGYQKGARNTPPKGRKSSRKK